MTFYSTDISSGAPIFSVFYSPAVPLPLSHTHTNTLYLSLQNAVFCCFHEQEIAHNVINQLLLPLRSKCVLPINFLHPNNTSNALRQVPKIRNIYLNCLEIQNLRWRTRPSEKAILQKFWPFRSGLVIARVRKMENNYGINQLNFYKDFACFGFGANIWNQTDFPRLT